MAFGGIADGIYNALDGVGQAVNMILKSQQDAKRGLQPLLASLQQAGLGDIAQSWVGNGPNKPITPEQLHTLLGQEQVDLEVIAVDDGSRDDSALVLAGLGEPR